MKKQLLRVIGLLLVITFILSSCEMTYTRDGWNGLADGAKVPAAFAIASGEPRIMLECLDGLRDKLNEGGLSLVEQGDIALDMIDLIAVLSNAIHNLAPFLLGQADPATISNINELFDSADQAILNLIAHEQLMETGIYADPAPMQLLWSILSLASYSNLIYANLTPEQQVLYPIMVAEASSQAADGSNTSFQPLLDEIQIELGW